MKDSAGNAVNPNGLSNIDYPYTSVNKAANDQYAGEWALKKILLPSGGQMEVQYEADDYAYVQNRRAGNMFNIYGLGSGTDYTSGNMLYTIYANQDQNYVYVKLPSPLQSTDPVKIRQEIFARYLDGVNQLAFKLSINMPKGPEPLTIFSNYDDYGVCTNSTDRTIIYLKLRPVDGKGPLANASVHFLIDNLPGQAFPGYDLSDDTGIKVFFDLIVSELSSLGNAFKNAENQMRSDGKGSTVSLASSFVRLNAPTFIKYGGGHRVKRVLVKDNWNAMSAQYNSQYGQDYDYTTTVKVNGIATTISSGVASYEPGIGSEENPFREILQFEDRLPLASAQYGSIEMPMLEGLYPAPIVGYSKVTVRSINRNGTHGDSAVRSAIGKQVTEFYTAKDYPSFSTYTPMNNVDYHHNPPFTFLYKETIDRRTTSQGFLVETNDMHGKIKSQAAYSESDGSTPLSYTLHTYKNTGANGLNDKVDFVHNDQGGVVNSGNMGVDMELMTDVREFSVISNGFNGQIQADFFTFVPWPVAWVFFYPLEAYSENKYRAVTTTKLINYHAIEDSVIVNDKGSTISTRTIAYDAETGSPIVNRTANEFNDPVYNCSYPAYWAYSGMGLAYKNIGMHFSGVNFSSGQIVSGVADQGIFESGDELYINPSSPGSGSPSCVPESPNANKLWVYDTSKNSTALTVPVAKRNLVIMDSAGRPFTKSGVSFTIVRSGKRNNLESTISNATSMLNPVQTVNGVRQLLISNADSVVAASATAYKEKWQADNDVIPSTSSTLVNCVSVESIDCNGTLPNHINPYVKGLVGNYKPYRSYTYYGSRMETDPSINTRIRKNGYIQGFGNYWGFDTHSNLVPDGTNTQWVWNSELTKVNAKGQELETRDALNRYTSAQYGFARSLPVAMIQNGRYGQSFDEGFEDYNYAETLNNIVSTSCDKYKYISFIGLANSSIINTDTSSIKAHTGKYILKVKPGTTVTKQLAVKSNAVDSFSFLLPSDTSRTLVNAGVNIQPIDYDYFIPYSNYYSNSYSFITQASRFSLFAGGAYGYVDTSITAGSANLVLSYFYTASCYIQIPQSGIYPISISTSIAPNPGSQAQISFDVYDLNNTDMGANNASDGNGNSTNICLPKGIYRIQCKFAGGSNLPGDQFDGSSQSFTLIAPSSVTFYKTLTTQNGCIFKDPIPARDSMLNPNFFIVPGNKMQFSAWVREDCGNAAGTPCYLTNYTLDHVAVQFPGSKTLPSVTLHPSGVIVEGWQKVEGSFTVPADATTANLVLSNDGANNVYFDDIRLHPFNAGMKSYVYDPRTLRLSAELDENNFATFYNYDEEGQLVRVKKETIQGIKTIKEVRSAQQKSIKTIQ